MFRATMFDYRRVLAAAVLLLGASTGSAAAHVNWFVDRTNAPQFEPYALSEPIVVIWLAIVALMVGFSIWLDGVLPSLRVPDSKTRHDFMEILRVFTGMSFLLTAYDGSLLAPHQIATNAVAVVLLFLQAAIGIMLIANRAIHIAGILMLVLHAGVAVKYGMLAALEYGILIGIALFLIFNNVADPVRREKLKMYSVDALRIWTGISLVALAFGEKLGPAALGQAFVAEYQWNFMEALGFGVFDDRLFVLSAGMVELALGLVLILGTVTRLAVFTLSVMMALSNVVFVAQGNKEAALIEFIGHMPIIGTALVLMLLGYGRRLKVTDLIAGRSRQSDEAALAR